ncbi:MAG: DinB family protein [Planctomycetota bacterium]
MPSNKDLAATGLRLALAGRFAHPEPADAVAGLSAVAAGTLPEGASRTIHEILGHLVYWQDVTLKWIDGVEPEAPATPEEPWPAGPKPESAEAWTALADRFVEGIRQAKRIAVREDLDAPLVGMEGATVFGALHATASHNSWHAGQIVMLRRMLGEWRD